MPWITATKSRRARGGAEDVRCGGCKAGIGNDDAPAAAATVRRSWWWCVVVALREMVQMDVGLLGGLDKERKV